MKMRSNACCICCSQPLEIDLDEIGDTVEIACGCSVLVIEGLLLRSEMSIWTETASEQFEECINKKSQVII